VSTASIVSIITAGVILLINVYYLGDRHGYERGFNDGKYKTLINRLEEIEEEVKDAEF